MLLHEVIKLTRELEIVKLLIQDKKMDVNALGNENRTRILFV